MAKKIEEIKRRRLALDPAAEALAATRYAPVGRDAPPTRDLVIERSISAAQRGVGETSSFDERSSAKPVR
jgi:hypothetical protein